MLKKIDTSKTDALIKKFGDKIIKKANPKYRINWTHDDVAVWNAEKRKHKYTWSGSGVLDVSESDAVLALHDVAHVIAASERRRKLPEFGLGSDPARFSGAECVVKQSTAKKEEYRVCFLHWAMVVYAADVGTAVNVCDYLSVDPRPDQWSRAHLKKRLGVLQRSYTVLPKDFSRVVFEKSQEAS